MQHCSEDFFSSKSTYNIKYIRGNAVLLYFYCWKFQVFNNEWQYNQVLLTVAVNIAENFLLKFRYTLATAENLKFVITKRLKTTVTGYRQHRKIWTVRVLTLLLFTLRSQLAGQQRFLDRLVQLISGLQKDRSDRKKKIEKLRALLSSESEAMEGFNFSSFDALPLPLDPEVKVRLLILVLYLFLFLTKMS